MKRYICTDKSPAKTDALLSASEEELRVLVLLLAADDPLSAEDLQAQAGLATLGDAKDALAFWRGAGLIRTATKKKEPAPAVAEEQEDVPAVEEKPPKKKKPVRAADELPTYSGSTLSEMIERDNLASFIEACQEIYGKVLSSTDINVLVGLREELHFDCESICLLLSYYAPKAAKPMRYVEKVAFSLFDRGIVSYAEIEAHIERMRRLNTREGTLRKLFGIGERALTPKEEAAFIRWCEEYGYDDAVIGMAYEQTVGATGKPSVPYADSIITRWNKAGCKNAADVLALIEREKAERAPHTPTKGEKRTEQDEMRSFDVDDFFRHALDRSYGKKEEN